MDKEINKIISWIEMGYTRLNYKEELLLVNYIKQLQQENKRLKEIENKLNFIKNRVKQGMSQENINKCAIELVNSYLKEVE